MALSPIHVALAHAIQRGLPLVSTPFRRIGDEFGLSEHQVLSQLRRWADDGKLREISAVLEARALGYESALVAATVPEYDLDAVAAIVCDHPTVSQVYRCRHDFNLWFDLAVPVEMGVESTLELLRLETGVAEMHPLRRTHRFKVDTNFDLLRKTNLTEFHPISEPEPLPLDGRTRDMLRALQVPIQLIRQPFKRLAELAGVEEGALLTFANAQLGGALRRYCATFEQRQLGIEANAVIAWQVDDSDVERLGPAVAVAPEVSHCVARAPVDGFPYTLFATVHGPDRATCRAAAQRLAKQTGNEHFVLLFSEYEYKKARRKYFLPDLETWWRQRQSAL